MMLGIAWFALAILCGVYASKQNRSGMLYFLIALFLSPIVGFIAVLVFGEKKKTETENDKVSDTQEFEDEDYTTLISKLLAFYKAFDLKQTDGYGNGTDVYRNDKDAYFYIRKQGSKIILQTFKLPKFEEKQEEVSNKTNVNDLVKLAELLEKGLLSKEEFEIQKAKLFNS